MADVKSAQMEEATADQPPEAPAVGKEPVEGGQEKAVSVLTAGKKKELEAGTALDTKRGMLRNVLKLAWQYLKSDQKKTAWRDIGLVIGLALGINYLNVLYNTWNGNLGNALEVKDWDGFLYQMMVGAGVVTARSLTGMFNIKRLGMLKSHWQEWLTKNMLNDLLDDQAYLRLQTVERNVANIEQITTKDAEEFSTTATDLAMGAFAAALSVATFMPILYSQAGDVNLSIFGGPDFVIPKMMFWFAPVYAVAGAYLSGCITRSLVHMLDNQRNLDSGLRNSVLRLIQYGESIALYKSEAMEKEILNKRVDAVIGNDRAVLDRQKYVALFQSFYTQAATLIPYLMAAPMYFFGGSGLGNLMSLMNAFNQAQSAMAWPITAAGPKAGLYALGKRIMRYQDEIEKLEKDDLAKEAEAAEKAEAPAGQIPGDQKNIILLRDGDTNNVVIDRLTLLQKEGEKPLPDGCSLNIAPGERIVITSRQEAAKPALVRALGGLETAGTGQIILPEGRKVLVEPKDAALPAMPLKGILSYPGAAGSYTRGRMEYALRAAGLKELIPYLDNEEMTGEALDKQLTPEEKQRLVFARILVQKPNVLVLENAASSLDDQTARTLYTLLTERMPTTIIIDFTQKESLAPLFTRHAEISQEGQLTIADVLQNDRGSGHFDYGVKPPPRGYHPYGVMEQHPGMPTPF